MQKASIYILVILTHCLPVKGQVNFDPIKICHDASKALRQVTVKEYVANIQNGQLASFYSKDGYITYYERDRKLILKEINKDDNNLDSISIQLTASGAVFSKRDKTTTVHKIRSVADDTAISAFVSPISFTVSYELEKLERIFVNIGNKNVEIRVHEDAEGYNWNIIIKTNASGYDLALTQLGGKNHFLDLHDDSNKIGISLWSDKRNGIFNLVQGLRSESKDLFSSDPDYKLFYSKKGILKSNKWKEPLRCD
jgi:hypothetical protein